MKGSSHEGHQGRARKRRGPVRARGVLGYPTVVEMTGFVGFDWVFIDTEQAAPSPGRELEHLIQAAYASDIAPTVRVPGIDAGDINKALNFGAKALWVPHVETAEEAERFVECSRYAPVGERGAAPIVRAARHGMVDFDEYRRRSNDEILLIPIIESVKGMENVREIAAVPGIDMLCFGAFDLGVSMGLSQEEFYGGGETAFLHEDLEDYARECIAACWDNGLFGSNLAWNKESGRRWVEMGYQFIIYGADMSLLLNGLKQLHAEANEVRAATKDVAMPARGNMP